MNWIGLVAGVCWAFLGAGGASVVWGWWMRRAVRRGRAAEARAVAAEAAAVAEGATELSRQCDDIRATLCCPVFSMHGQDKTHTCDGCGMEGEA